MLGITTVVYNQLSFCQQAIEAVLMKTRNPFYYVIIYNGSPYPGVRQYLEKLRGDLRPNRAECYLMIKYNEKNLGVSSAYAQGYQELKAQGCLYFIKLDDDTVLQTEGWDHIMLDAFTRFRDLAVLSADLDRGKQEGPSITKSKGNIDLEVFPDNPCVGGAATMYPMWLFESMGFFKNFGLYAHEDGEFCARVKQAKLTTAYIRNVKAIHLARTDVSDKYLDDWKLQYHYGKTKLDYPTWLKECEDKEVKEVQDGI